jgi:endonuclease/exonuclease/phosphatase family metal-dependent hydrolase
MDSPPPRRRLRVATLNLWNVSEPLAERRILVEEGLARLRADVVGLQEVVDAPEAAGRQAHELAARDGYHVAYAAEAPFRDGSLGNAILSRYPIVGREARALPHPDGEVVRCVLRADLALPEGLLHFFCAHLSHRADEGWKRERQVEALDAFVRESSSALPRIVVGDLNADPDSSEIRFLTGKATLGGRSTYYQDAAAIVGAPEPTWSRRNRFTAPYGEGDRRIDYVLVTHARADGRGVVERCRLAFAEPGPDGIFPSDHFGVVAEVWL